MLVDQYDALRSQRPYEQAFDYQKTFKIIADGDPAVPKAFKEVAPVFEERFDQHQ